MLENNEKKTEERVAKVGRFIGHVFAGVIAGCLSALAIALTIKMITMLLF